VLTACRVPHELAVASVRLSLGSMNTDAHVARVAELFPALIAKARRLSGLMTG
jgi:cysteine sulfinate desulfinase/cysteine desulfurase-like protein